MRKIHPMFAAAFFASGLILPVSALAGGHTLQTSMQNQHNQNMSAGNVTGAYSMKNNAKSTGNDQTNTIQPKPLSTSAVKTVQKALDQHGASVKVNGHMDLKTIESLMKFQRKHNIAATGFLNRKTATKLGIASTLKHKGVKLS